MARTCSSAATKILISWTVVMAALFLQGCNMNIPMHQVGNWQAKPSYLKDFEYVAPGKKKSGAILNSCKTPASSTTLQCSGHGRCRDWYEMTPMQPTLPGNPTRPKLSFCECDRYYADPECRTARKSQISAFLFSLFFGYLGADQLYLGFICYAVAKLALLVVLGGAHYIFWDHAWWVPPRLMTLGACAIWYTYDVVRIGSSTVYTHSNFQLAEDLPHFVFVLAVITAALLGAFGIALRSIGRLRNHKKHEIMVLRAQAAALEENVNDSDAEENAGPDAADIAKESATPLRKAGFSGYGATLHPRFAASSTTIPVATLPVNPVTTQVAQSRAAMPAATFQSLPFQM